MAEFGMHLPYGSNQGYPPQQQGYPPQQQGYPPQQQQQYPVYPPQPYPQPIAPTSTSGSPSFGQPYMYQQQPAYPQQPFGNMDWYSTMSTSEGVDTSGNLGTMSFNHRGSTSFDDEPPLLEELGIDVSAIFLKTRAILFHRMKALSLDDLDMGGAILFVCILGGLHLLMGKWHMGVILGWSVLQSVVLWWLANQLVGSAAAAHPKSLDLYHTCCLVGYSMIPQLLLSCVVLLLPRSHAISAAAILATLWSGVTAARLLVRRAPSLQPMFPLLFYPCTLVYASFAMLSIY